MREVKKMLRKLGVAAVLVVLAIIAFVLPAASQQVPSELAVYSLTGEDSKAVAKEAFKIAGSEKTEGSGEDASDVITGDGKKVVVVKKNQKIYYEDTSKLMRDPQSQEAKDAQKNLPDQANAKAKSEKLLAETNLGPASGGVLSLQPATVSGSGAAIFDVASGTEEIVQLDVVSTSTLKLVDEGLDVPVIGTSYQVILGANGEVTGYSGPQPQLKATRGKKSKAITRESAEAKFKEDNKNATNVNSKFLYYASPDENILLPVYAISSSTNLDGGISPMRTTLVSAIEGREVYPGKEQKRADKGRKETQPKSTPTADMRDSNELRIMSGIPGEAATEYIGVSGGLSQSRANALGFTSALRNAGWTINFEWGDYNCWESDFIANDDSYVDSTDILFYSGHANANGWMAYPPNSNFVSYTSVGTRCGTPDIWGTNDLEWLVIAACGPLQDSHIPGASGDAFTRWGGAFDGLHALLGYAQVTYDQPYEGPWFANNMKAGMPVIDAWFKAARDAQPDGHGIYAVALYGVKNGVSCRNDHLWGYGSVASDPYPCPDTLVLTWYPCG
jgi:hypothetical protein